MLCGTGPAQKLVLGPRVTIRGTKVGGGQLASSKHTHPQPPRGDRGTDASFGLIPIDARQGSTFRRGWGQGGPPPTGLFVNVGAMLFPP